MNIPVPHEKAKAVLVLLKDELRAAEESASGKAERDFRRSERESTPQDLKLKTLYRNLARRLHPDANVELDQRQKALWYQAQEAYEAGDIERLETLSAMSEIMDDTAESIESVWSLKNLYEELRSGLRQIRAEIASQLWDDKAELLDLIDLAEVQIDQ